jgi:signal transduction histidine kinase
LRAKLARALGDPSLVVGYRLPEADGFVDDAGRPVELPTVGSGRVVTAIADGGEQVAVLVHDEALLADKHLVESVAAAARVAVANARLQAEAQARADELVASRRRIVQAADEQRRLENVQALLEGARNEVTAHEADAISALEQELDTTRRELREFAHGVHPGALTDGGLMPALAQLSERSPIPVAVTGDVPRLTAPVEAALYFVCSEALANAAKHARASRISVEVRQDTDRVVVAILDDGAGGASPERGSGLRGLADRVQALGGQLRVESPPGAGTRVSAEITLGG